MPAQAQAAAEPAQFAQSATDGFYAGYDSDPAMPEQLGAVRPLRRADRQACR